MVSLSEAGLTGTRELEVGTDIDYTCTGIRYALKYIISTDRHLVVSGKNWRWWYKHLLQYARAVTSTQEIAVSIERYICIEAEG